MESVSEPRFGVAVIDQPGTPAKSTASWSAIVAGAFVAIAVSLVLFALGSGLGFAAISPWDGQGLSMSTFAVTTAIWLIVMQWLSSAVGGYIAGRLRSRWHGTHPHEVFFRDTAHGFVTWAVATVAVASVLATSALSALSGGAHVATNVATSAAQGAAGTATPSYVYGLDRLFRPSDASAAVAQSSGPDVRPEVTHVIVQAVVTNGTVAETDRIYLASLVAARTGVSTDEARTRVNEFIGAANQVKDNVKAGADAARKAAAKTAIFTALALAVGAFIACLTAALGGKIRDEHP